MAEWSLIHSRVAACVCVLKLTAFSKMGGGGALADSYLWLIQTSTASVRGHEGVDHIIYDW